MNTENQVSKAQMSNLPYIIAVDFDGTLVEDNFPAIGTPYPQVFELAKAAKENGARLILWTCRDGEVLQNAVQFCRDNGLTFDAINDNIPEVQQMFNHNARKVYANEYWDDKAVVFGVAQECGCPPGCTCETGPSYLCQP